MDFRQALLSSLPSPDWPERTARTRVAVVVADRRDWTRWLPAMRAVLAPEELARMDRRRVREDAETSLMALAMLRMLLAAILGRPPDALPLWRDGNGKPRVGADEWHASIAHAGGRAMLGISRTGPVGVDLEPLARLPGMAEIAARICHADEAWVSGLPEPVRSEALLALWVRKEAVLKAEGIGLGREMDEFAAPADVPLPLGDTGSDTVARMLEVGPGWAAAVAAPPGLSAVAVRAVPLS